MREESKKNPLRLPVWVERLHDAVEGLVRPLLDEHQDRLCCQAGCADCCVDDISVFSLEADLIREKFPHVLQEESHPMGACAFLSKEKTCRIYAHRPYVCRTQGLPLRWYDEKHDVEQRDICVRNEHGRPLVELSPEACWTIGPVEIKLQDAQKQAGALTRVRLRDLFEQRRLS